MDIISSINSALTQFHRDQHMTMSSGDDTTRNQVQFRANESNSTSFGKSEGNRPGGHYQHPGSAVENVRDAVHNAVNYDRSERGTLQMRTQEGDIVRIKFVNSESVNAQNQPFENGGSVISDLSIEGSNSSQFKVIVDGDLNAQELSAVRDVLVQAREMANTFYDGDVKDAFELASNFEIDSEQLANVNMSLRLQETYTYGSAASNPQIAQLSDAIAPGDQIQSASPLVDSVPTAVPVSIMPQPANVTAQLSQPDLAVVAPATNEPPTSAVTQASPLVLPTPTHIAPDPAENLATALSTITDFLNQLTESLNAFSQQFQSPGADSPNSFSQGFQLQVVSALVGQMESPSVEKPFAGHTLAAETINELAMKLDAHVDDMV